ncbi:hypothetical protein [Mucilaginibacter xinganensis]|uniref:Uncharacterized protein n=1 Tax=Mucilaginibacter xinganensis TaxID=1234841 RepID=A0A223NQI8_9SPHI|nr:hypothetical protein [Mucilaginibacter xinganensis]ASU31954.1 hypothetical protein MuYL_0051 [Mucilaginibacter xinganensis]
MDTIKIQSSTQWANEGAARKSTLWNKFNAFADGQKQNKTLWFFVALIGQGVLFLPLPALLMYYFNAPIIVLVITLSLYFANIIAGMGGSGIRTMMLLLSVSVLVHVIMLLAFII